MTGDHLSLGICALARAGINANCYQGHFGNAILAAHFMCADLPLGPETTSAVRSATEYVVAQEPDLFHSLSSEIHDPSKEASILETAERHISTLSRSGHVAIVTAFAIRALRERPDLLTPTHARGICSLIEAYTKERSEPRYFGFPRDYARIQVRSEDAIPCYTCASDALRLAIEETDELFPDMHIDNTKYYMTGEKLHAITHAHALVMLETISLPRLAQKAYDAHRLQIKLNRMRPPFGTDILVEVESATAPTNAVFWQQVGDFKQELGLPHAFKRAYALLAAAALPGTPVAEARYKRLWGVLKIA